jgi:hypothetical protein
MKQKEDKDMRFKSSSAVMNGSEPSVADEVISAATAKKMILSAIGKADTNSPNRVLLYGPEGIGKTWFAAQAEKPIFICAEEGLRGVVPQPDVFPEPTSWLDILDAIETLRIESHNYKTLVVDTIDWAEALSYKHVCKKNDVVSIEEVGGGWGKGYIMAQEEWRNLLQKINHLRREKAMDVVFLAHSNVKTFQNPAGENYDKWQMKANEKIYSILKEWSDAVLFANYEVFVDIKKGQRKGKGVGGDKVLYATHTPVFDAKNRYGIDGQVPFQTNEDIAAFWNLVRGGKS